MTSSPKISASTNHSNSSMSNSVQPPTQQSATSSAPHLSTSSSTSTWIKAQAAAVYPYAVLKKGRRNLPLLKSSSSSSSSKTQQASEGVSKTERFPTSLSMTRTGGPPGFGFSPLTPITPPSSTSSPSLKSPRTSLHSNTNGSSGNISLSDSSHMYRHGLVQSTPSTDTHFVGLGLKISERMILHLHDDEELYTEQMAEALPGSIFRERERGAVASGLVGNVFLDQESSISELEKGRCERHSDESHVISNDAENDKIIPPPTPVPLVLELASSPPPSLRSTLLTELTDPDEKDWPEFTPLPDPALSLECSSEKPNSSGANQYLYQHRSHLKHNDLHSQHNNPYPLQQQQNLQQQENVLPHHHHHLHHQHHHPHHSYIPHHIHSSKELGYMRECIGEKELLTPKASVSPSSKGNIKGMSNHSSASKDWKPKSTTTGEPEPKGSSYTPGGGSNASVSGRKVEDARVQLKEEDETRRQANEYQKKQQKDQQQPLPTTKQPVQPLQQQIEQVRRGRSQRPRLLWRSTLPLETLNILDQHHLKRYGEKIPRLPVRSSTGVATATGTRGGTGTVELNSTAPPEEASDPIRSSMTDHGTALSTHKKDHPSSKSPDLVQSTFAPLPHEAAEGHRVIPMSQSSPIKHFIESPVIHDETLVDGGSSQTSAVQETCSGETVEQPNLISSEIPISAETSTKFVPTPTATLITASVAIPSSKKKTRRNTIRLASLSRQGRKWSRELDKSGL